VIAKYLVGVEKKRRTTPFSLSFLSQNNNLEASLLQSNHKEGVTVSTTTSWQAASFNFERSTGHSHKGFYWPHQPSRYYQPSILEPPLHTPASLSHSLPRDHCSSSTSRPRLCHILRDCTTCCRKVWSELRRHECIPLSQREHTHRFKSAVSPSKTSSGRVVSLFETRYLRVLQERVKGMALSGHFGNFTVLVAFGQPQGLGNHRRHLLIESSPLWSARDHCSKHEVGIGSLHLRRETSS